MTQGNQKSTGQPTDIAILGEVFFLLGDGAGISYTRSGVHGDRSVTREIYLEEIDFKFEKEPAGTRGIDLTVKRKEGGENGQWSERTVRVSWEPVLSSRVDAKWNKKENTLNVWSLKASGFTLFFADDLIAPGKEFHLFINNVPYQDLADPKTTPDYPRVRPGSGPALADELYRMRRQRAKVEGWKPDIKWAIEKHLETWDRRLILGADTLMTRLQEGSGTLGLLMADSALYREATATVVQLRELLADIQANPRKYFKFSVF